jgi:ubiquinone/menaquinone biosynthesis C-methylase UbiE/uncharacterized protein YbaR (Trm112 family)
MIPERTLRASDENSMKISLLNDLICPVTGSSLQLVGRSPDTGAEINSGQLQADGRSYEVIDGIPVLLATDTLAPGQAETLASFAEKWKLVPNYRIATRDHYTEWYLERYGFKTLNRLREFLETKQRILDAGTGLGRDAELFAHNTSGTVYAVDASSSVFGVYGDLASHENLNIVQADLTRLPFRQHFFDFISCDQVLHHTPNTRKSLSALLRNLMPGGYIAFYVYKKKAPIREFCDDYIRQFTNRMSPEECLRTCEGITNLGKALSELNVKIQIAEDIPILQIKAGTYDLQRFVYWHMLKCYWNENLDWEMNCITNFDWYHPLHAHRHTREEVQRWCVEENLDIVNFDVVESGISVLARKPA